MAPLRFRRLPVHRLPGGLVVCDAVSVPARLLGLSELRAIPADVALRLPRTRSVHTLGMRFALDLVWCDASGSVVRVDESVRPARVRTCWAARSVVETVAGQGRAFAAALGAVGSSVVDRATTSGDDHPMSSPAQFASETDDSGRFVRQQSEFRDWVRADGSTPYAPDAGRYHLYVSYACPWACRAIIVRRLKGLEEAIGMTVVDPIRDDAGWRFLPDAPDPVNGFRYLSEAYLATDPAFEGRVTVPTLWDTQTGRVVNNESADIIRMLNSEFDGVAEHPEVDLYPEALRDEIDRVNERVYADVNNGVYEAGFATTQASYEEAFDRVFAALDWAETRLAHQRFLTGDRITEADWRLFTTLVRFDPVYVGHFKCNLRRIADYPSLDNYLRDLYQRPGIADTVVLDHIKRHYYMTHRSINGNGLVPKGPALDWHAPHDRGRLPEASYGVS